MRSYDGSGELVALTIDKNSQNSEVRDEIIENDIIANMNDKNTVD